MSRKPLGRGIKALIAQSDEVTEGIQHIPVDAIQPNPKQPRRVFEEGPLRELAESIREHGVLEPLIVRPVGAGYEIVVGERRWRASQLAGVATVPAVVRPLTEREAMELALVENLQREDLNPVEEAEAYRRLIEEFGLTQEEVAVRVGKERSTVANRLRLLALSGFARKALEQGLISAGHAKAVLGVEDEAERDRLVERIVEEGLSVRQAEELARRLPAPRVRRGKAAVQRDVHLAELEDELRRMLGTKVHVIQRGSGGRIEIEFYGEEDIERILSLLRGEA